MKKIDDHHYEATASDVVGTAKGFSYGRKFADLKKFSKNREKFDHVGCQN